MGCAQQPYASHSTVVVFIDVQTAKVIFSKPSCKFAGFLHMNRHALVRPIWQSVPASFHYQVCDLCTGDVLSEIQVDPAPHNPLTQIYGGFLLSGKFCIVRETQDWGWHVLGENASIIHIWDTDSWSPVYSMASRRYSAFTPSPDELSLAVMDFELEKGCSHDADSICRAPTLRILRWA